MMAMGPLVPSHFIRRPHQRGRLGAAQLSIDGTQGGPSRGMRAARESQSVAVIVDVMREVTKGRVDGVVVARPPWLPLALTPWMMTWAALRGGL